MSRLALHQAAMPNIFLLLFFIFFLLVCFRRLSTLLPPPMYEILVVYCKSCVCYFATSCIPSLMPSPCTVAALSYDFTNEVPVLSTDEVSTVRSVAARLSPLKEYSYSSYSSHARRCNPTPEISACMAFRQSSHGLTSIM